MTHEIIVTVAAPDRHSLVGEAIQRRFKGYLLKIYFGSSLKVGIPILTKVSKDFQKESFTPFLNYFHSFKLPCQKQLCNMAQTVGMAYPLRNDFLTIKSIAL